MSKQQKQRKPIKLLLRGDATDEEIDRFLAALAEQKRKAGDAKRRPDEGVR